MVMTVMTVMMAMAVSNRYMPELIQMKVMMAASTGLERIPAILTVR